MRKNRECKQKSRLHGVNGSKQNFIQLIEFECRFYWVMV